MTVVPMMAAPASSGMLLEVQICVCVCYLEMRIEPRASHVVGKHSPTELLLQPVCFVLRQVIDK